MQGRKGEVITITIQEQIELAAKYSKISKTEIAAALGYTPQAFYQRMKTGKFTKEELEKIGSKIGANYISKFQFPDGMEF